MSSSAPETPQLAPTPQQPAPPAPTSASAPAPSLWNQGGQRMLRWLKSRLARDRLLGSLKTLGWVIPLTILIWVYADREQIIRANNITIPIQITTTAMDRIVRVRSDRNIVVDVEGPRAGLDRLRQQMQQPGTKAIEIKLSKDELPLDRPSRDIPIQDRIAQEAIFKDNAVTITTCYPRAITVDVDPLKTVKLPVAPTPEPPPLLVEQGKIGKLLLEADPVEVTAPESLLVERPDRKLVLLADVSRFIDRAPGRYTEDLPLRFPDETSVAQELLAHVTMPKTVHATVEIKPPDTATYELDSVPVLLLLPRPVSDRYRIEWEPVVTNANGSIVKVSVVGPQNQIEQLRSSTKSFPFHATLRISVAEAAKAAASATTERKVLTPADFYLPEGVKIAEGAVYSASFKVIRRSDDVP